MASSRIQLISKKIIKPSSPTPSSLGSYKFSFLDQLSTDSYMPIASFYPNQHQNNSLGTTQISQLLESSLSRLLRSYYPFAGTLKDNVSINCNDSGVTLVETQIKSSMAEFLKEPDSSVMDIVFPSDLPWNRVDKDNLVVAQLNHFDCGGKSLGVCMSHKLGDGSTLATFMSDWAAMARQSSKEPSPQFIGASVVPPKDTPVVPIYEIHRRERASRRFLLGGKKIAQLKEAVAGESGVSNPTRVEVVTAFLCKAAMAAKMVNSSQSFTPSLLLQTVNLRHLSVPPLAHNSVGNFYSMFYTQIVDEREMKLSRLVSKLRRNKIEFYEKCKQMGQNESILKGLQDLEKHMELLIQGMDCHHCSSLCGFPLNNLDFGWGRPIKVALGAVPYPNAFILMDDNNGDGVEATVTLDEKIMSIFQRDKDLMDFASPY